MSNAREVIDRYFDLAPQADADAYCAQFTADAIVEDEDQAYRGIAAIRVWRTKVPRVAYAIHDVKAARTRPRRGRRHRRRLPRQPRHSHVPFPVRG